MRKETTTRQTSKKRAQKIKPKRNTKSKKKNKIRAKKKSGFVFNQNFGRLRRSVRFNSALARTKRATGYIEAEINRRMSGGGHRERAVGGGLSFQVLLWRGPTERTQVGYVVRKKSAKARCKLSDKLQETNLKFRFRERPQCVCVCLCFTTSASTTQQQQQRLHTSERVVLSTATWERLLVCVWECLCESKRVRAPDRETTRWSSSNGCCVSGVSFLHTHMHTERAHTQWQILLQFLLPLLMPESVQRVVWDCLCVFVCVYFVALVVAVCVCVSLTGAFYWFLCAQKSIACVTVIAKNWTLFSAPRCLQNWESIHTYIHTNIHSVK